MEPWTNREVEFTVFPRTTDDEYERLVDELTAYFLDNSVLRKRLVHGVITGHRGRSVTVGNLPVWLPKWYARRVVTNVADKIGVGGDARYIIERSTLGWGGRD